MSRQKAYVLSAADSRWGLVCIGLYDCWVSDAGTLESFEVFTALAASSAILLLARSHARQR